MWSFVTFCCCPDIIRVIKTEDGEIGGAYSTHGGDDKRILDFRQKKRREDIASESWT
jgi:hypothetical protein